MGFNVDRVSRQRVGGPVLVGFALEVAIAAAAA